MTAAKARQDKLGLSSSGLASRCRFDSLAYFASYAKYERDNIYPLSTEILSHTVTVTMSNNPILRSFFSISTKVNEIRKKVFVSCMVDSEDIIDQDSLDLTVFKILPDFKKATLQALRLKQLRRKETISDPVDHYASCLVSHLACCNDC